MKKSVLVVLLALLCASALVFTACDAGSFSQNEGTFGLEYYPLPDGTFAVASGTAIYLEEIVIPKEYMGKEITVIPENAFRGCTTLKK